MARFGPARRPILARLAKDVGQPRRLGAGFAAGPLRLTGLSIECRMASGREVMGGKPVVRGTRVLVEIVLRKFGAGISPEAIVADHPRLTAEDIFPPYKPSPRTTVGGAYSDGMSALKRFGRPQSNASAALEASAS